MLSSRLINNFFPRFLSQCCNGKSR
uniref:Uncharacterized protein n=1 Tax=Solanum lycopersicum TaxID=4081 RepID=A0A3Q7HUT3_SOLLC